LNFIAQNGCIKKSALPISEFLANCQTLKIPILWEKTANRYNENSKFTNFYMQKQQKIANCLIDKDVTKGDNKS
jgi:hypothetical protein